ncbi:MAG: winged helix-turn-helix domain-containing protein [Candidatus Bathyarchaeia archaeon]|jgi:DNA-binding transcriptional ArsR family regulator
MWVPKTTKQNQQTDQEEITKALRALTHEVGSLKTELGRIESVILKDRLGAVEEALSQNRLMQYADLLNEEANEDIGKLLNADCEKRTKCHEYFREQLAEILSVAKSRGSKEALADLDARINQIGNQVEKAKGTQCESCQTKFQKKLKREKRAFQTIVLVEKADSRSQEVIDVPFIVENLLEPLANPVRLKILISLYEGKKNFSKLSQTMELKGGHLIFHLKKLLDSKLIAQEDNKGDYIITPNGVDAIKKILFLQTTEKQLMRNI